MKIFLISGKARNGKNTIANYIEEYYKDKGLKVLQQAYAKYIRMFAQELSDWDGNDDTKPRSLLQEIGTEVIRKKLNKEDFFVKRMVEDISIYKEFVDVIIINDVRFPIEIDYLKEYYKEAIAFNVKRINYESELTSTQQSHTSEIALDNYDNYDYKLINDTLDQLKVDVIKILDTL